MKETKPLVSTEELEALIQGWGAMPSQSVDKFFPARFFYAFLVIFVTALWLLFNSASVAQTLSTDTLNQARLQHFLYFRGWFLLGVLTLGAYSYFRNWYPAIIFSAFLLIGLTNLISDLFTVYPERLASPNPFFTTFLLVRITLLWVLYIAVKNASRLPDAKDRANLFLPFKRSHS
jgi:hypothetical protein